MPKVHQHHSNLGVSYSTPPTMTNCATQHFIKNLLDPSITWQYFLVQTSHSRSPNFLDLTTILRSHIIKLVYTSFAISKVLEITASRTENRPSQPSLSVIPTRIMGQTRMTGFHIPDIYSLSMED